MKEIRNMKNLFFQLAVLCIVLFFTGCSPRGFLFTKTTMPLDTNLSQTPCGLRQGKGNIKHFHYYVDIKWSSNAIGNIARKNGIETVYFADIETLSIFGIWNQHIINIYGE